MKSETKDPCHFYLFTLPRSASNLLLRILALENQPSVASREKGGYFFLEPILLANTLGIRAKPVQEWHPDEVSRMRQCYQASFEELHSHLRSADEQNKIVFIKDHSYFMADPYAQERYLRGEPNDGHRWPVEVSVSLASQPKQSRENITVLPDQVLERFLPIFLVRHPILAFPSLYRTTLAIEGPDVLHTHREELELTMTLHWSRQLYDFYWQRVSDYTHGGVEWPLVLDADDIIQSPYTLARLAGIMGMSTEALRFTWTAASKEDLSTMKKDVVGQMYMTLASSEGIQKDKVAAGLSLAREVPKWKDEFGAEAASALEGWVKAALPDYEYLRDRKLKSSNGDILSE